MEDRTILSILASVVALIILTAIVSYNAGRTIHHREIQQHMTTTGVAEYQVDKKTGKLTFVILTNQCNHVTVPE